MTSRTHLKRKEVDDVMGGEAAWENVDKVPGKCKKGFPVPTMCNTDRCLVISGMSKV